MDEYLENAFLELKRVDHLYYVSLKYTRTVDMIKHMLDRLISTLSFGIESLLNHAKEQKKINEVPSNLGLRAKLVIDTFQDEQLTGYMHFYLKLRKILRANYTKREEFRRHVTMTVTVDEQVIEVNIDVLYEYYDRVKNFVENAYKLIHGIKDD